MLTLLPVIAPIFVFGMVVTGIVMTIVVSVRAGRARRRGRDRFAAGHRPPPPPPGYPMPPGV